MIKVWVLLIMVYGKDFPITQVDGFESEQMCLSAQQKVISFENNWQGIKTICVEHQAVKP